MEFNIEHRSLNTTSNGVKLTDITESSRNMDAFFALTVPEEQAE